MRLLGGGEQGQHLPDRLALWTWLYGGQKLLERTTLPVVILEPSGTPSPEGFRPLLAKPVDDAIAGHPQQPGTGLLNRLHQAMSGDELVQHFLEDVLRLGGVLHAAANEIP